MTTRQATDCRSAGVLELARQFYLDHQKQFNAAGRKLTPAKREFSLPRSDFWAWCKKQSEIPGAPTDPDLDRSTRRGRFSQVNDVVRRITGVAANPAHSTDTYPIFRIVYHGHDRTAMLVQLGDAFSSQLNIEPVQKASRYIAQRKKVVARNARWAKKNPSMPGSSQVLETSALTEVVLDETSTFLMKIAQRLATPRLPPPALPPPAP